MENIINHLLNILPISDAFAKTVLALREPKPTLSVYAAHLTRLAVQLHADGKHVW